MLRVNEEVIVRLKWGQTEYKGRLVSVDSYMNIQLTGTEEFIDQKSTASLGQVLIRYVDHPASFFTGRGRCCYYYLNDWIGISLWKH